MGLHRSDPMGIARIALVGVGVIFVFALVYIGATGLLASFGNQGAPPSESPSEKRTAVSEDTDAPPTLAIKCVADSCPVFVRIPGGDVLLEQATPLGRGQTRSYDEPKLAVSFVADQVELTVNGDPYDADGEKGTRQHATFTRK